MAAGNVNSDLEELGSESENVNKNKLSDDGGSIFGVEIFNHQSESDDGDEENSSAEITDAEVTDLEKRLKNMKLEEKRLKKLEKYRRLSAEAEQVEKSIKSLKGEKKNGKEKKKKITAGALRGMKHVMDEVDKIMDEKVKRSTKVKWMTVTKRKPALMKKPRWRALWETKRR